MQAIHCKVNLSQRTNFSMNCLSKCINNSINGEITMGLSPSSKILSGLPPSKRQLLCISVHETLWSSPSPPSGPLLSGWGREQEEPQQQTHGCSTEHLPPQGSSPAILSKRPLEDQGDTKSLENAVLWWKDWLFGEWTENSQLQSNGKFLFPQAFCLMSFLSQSWAPGSPLGIWTACAGALAPAGKSLPGR